MDESIHCVTYLTIWRCVRSCLFLTLRWSVRALFESVMYMMSRSDVIVYSPRIKLTASAILIQVELVPQCLGRHQDQISRTFATLFCHSVESGSSSSLMSGATILMLVVAIPVLLRLPSILTNMGKSCCIAVSIIS